ncbi:potassium-transporting ATPase subunit KdpC [Methylocella sp.]|uniref:potassium-transporting ATPase subunit KdpC n=1 Tax=Methylocella sp. TaxID=1978226 RepID=UPI003783A8FB
MFSQIRPAIVMIVLFTLLTGIAYPLLVAGLARVALRPQADGSLLARDGEIVGSALIGQNFTSDKYFHGRPSATAAPDPTDAGKTVEAPYNAANSGGSNLGPTSQKLVDRVKAGVAALGGGPHRPVPADAVTTSASGLDPHISPQYALWQVGRVAAARGLKEESVRRLVTRRVETPFLGVFGEPRVNVLTLNLNLDRGA